MDIAVEEFEQLTEEYFADLTSEKLETDCRKADIKFYNTIKENILTEV